VSQIRNNKQFLLISIIMPAYKPLLSRLVASWHEIMLGILLFPIWSTSPREFLPVPSRIFQTEPLEAAPLLAVPSVPSVPSEKTKVKVKFVNSDCDTYDLSRLSCYRLQVKRVITKVGIGVSRAGLVMALRLMM
jgi:hypothetical protein